jgi:hypothetical protein
MSLAEFLSTFRKMHEQARRGLLEGKELALYLAKRDELARALLSAQRLTIKQGETARQALRVARALKIELDFGMLHPRALTLDLSKGGFATVLVQAPSLKDEVGFTLHIPPAKPVSGKCRVVNVKQHAGNVRVAFQFTGLSEADRERLELFVFDAVLEQLVD